MKKIILFTLALLMSISFAVAFTVDISYTDSSIDGKPLVADVPFDIAVAMNTNDNDVLSYNLFVTSADARAQFTSASRGTLFPANDLDGNSGAQSGNTIYRYQVKPKVGYEGNSNTAASLFILRSKISGIAPSTIQLKREGTMVHTDNVITPAATGVSVESINDITRTITPLLSTCGDGVVGYFDAGDDGIKDAGELNEACDDGNTDGSTARNRYANSKDGCSSDCKVVDLGWDCANKNFGDRLSVCSALSAREFLVQKLTALINGQCYPDCQHPAAMYIEESSSAPRLTYDDDGKLDTSEKIYLIAQIGTALREFFSQTLQTTAGS